MKINHGKTIFRYLDEKKFNQLLKQKGIFFSRLDLMDDKYELPMMYLQHKSFPYHVPETRNYIDPTWIPRQVGTNQDYLNNHYAKNFFISCWTRQEHESYALWKIYSKMQGYRIGVFINVLIEQIKQCVTELNKHDCYYKYFDIYYGDVQYYASETELIGDHILDKIKKINFNLSNCNIEKLSYFDHDDDLEHAINSVFKKMNFYDFEKEFRILIHFGQTEMQTIVDLMKKKTFKNVNIIHADDNHNLLKGFVLKTGLDIVNDIVCHPNSQLKNKLPELKINPKSSDILLGQSSAHNPNHPL